ncbi:MAG: hypothetical protein Q9227_001130 [Pyrenula ochraceoflavens]
MEPQDTTTTTTTTDSTTDSIVPKAEPLQDGFTSSSSSTPDVEGEVEAEAAPSFPDAPHVQKRKGGRKPVRSPTPGKSSRLTMRQIYATSEERKQRNRQAQAAFRERRTEYIKQLETTIKHHEENLQSLQQSHRSAADECLMLRYKNSLLERILLEKGIDVQAELQSKGVANIPSKSQAPSQPQPTPRRMSRPQQMRMQAPSARPKLDTAIQSHQTVFPSHSPSLHPSSSSHTSSPSLTRSPGFAVQGGISPPVADLQAQQRPQPSQQSLPPQPNPFVTRPSFTQIPATAPQAPSQTHNAPPAGVVQPAFYPGPFQKHYDQLGKLTPFLSSLEYDAQANMLDDPEVDESTEVDHFVSNFNHHPASDHSQRIGLHGQMPPHSQGMDASADPGGTGMAGPGAPAFDQFDPMLDADPFGLTASMHFPTPYNYEQYQHRQGQ